MEKKRILITGGSGMIGQEIATQLQETGEWEIFIYDDFSNRFTPKSEFIGERIYGGEFGLNIWIKANQPAVISHQASLVSVGASMYNPRQFFDQNVQFTANLIQILFDTSWKGHLILGSSMGVYGEGSGPVSFYGQTKKFQEELLQLAAKTYGFDLTILRYFSVYSTTSEPKNPYTGILSIIINQILTSDKIEMYEDGGQSRDLIDVRDVAVVHNSRLEYSARHPIVDVRTGRVRSMRTIVDMVQKELGNQLPVIFNKKHRAGDVYEVVEASSHFKCRSLLDGVKEYCDFIKAKYLNDVSAFVDNVVEKENLNIERKGLVK